MSQSTKVESLDTQIANYVSRLSEARKEAVLTVAKTFAEDEEAQHRLEFEKKWANGVSLEVARQNTLNTVKRLFDEKNNSK